MCFIQQILVNLFDLYFRFSHNHGLIYFIRLQQFIIFDRKLFAPANIPCNQHPMNKWNWNESVTNINDTQSSAFKFYLELDEKKKQVQFILWRRFAFHSKQIKQIIQMKFYRLSSSIAWMTCTTFFKVDPFRKREL